MGNLAQPLAVALENRIEDRRATRVGKQLAAQANQPAAGDTELQAHPAVAVVVHARHLPFACTQLLDHHAHKVLRYIDDQLLRGLHQLAGLGVASRDDLGLAHH